MAKTSKRRGQQKNLREFLNQRVEDLRRLIPRGGDTWSVDAIHDARVATRRVRAALDLLEPLLSQAPRRAFAKVLKRLRRTLAPLRDHDIMILLLQNLQRKTEVAAAV